ncbi:MAG: NAD(P)H-quinone oxidoreductase [Hyphomicrobiaceae bacterium]|nr:NAD(P)H-quinone oxidoreductase [Hyphomicrobiaceae bacterium]MCC0011488.1 NAD(P)H-quinone oxidoreductase [Hyphomicrobiaceae bacterium]
MSTLPDTMTAIDCDGKGGPEILVPRQMPVPKPGPGQVLIKVHAAGVNRPDVLQRQGLYPAPKSHSAILGLEVAGEVAATGDAETGFNPGDKVMALVNGGGYAQYCIADAPATLPIPNGLSMIEAAAVPETFFTVWHNVFERAALQPGEWFMIHGGTSGIGVTAIQLAKAFGAHVIATAGSPEKCDACKQLGADHTVDYRQQDFVEVTKEVTGKRGVNVILDMVGGDYVERNIRSLGDDGRLVYIAFLKGSKVEVDLMRVMLKRLTITGSTLRIRPTEVKGRIASALSEKVMPLFSEKKLKVVLDSTFPLEDAAKAHTRLDEGGHIGKIVLTV